MAGKFEWFTLPLKRVLFHKVPQKGVDVVDVDVGGDVAGVASEIRPERQLDHD